MKKCPDCGIEIKRTFITDNHEYQYVDYCPECRQYWEGPEFKMYRKNGKECIRHTNKPPLRRSPNEGK